MITKNLLHKSLILAVAAGITFSSGTAAFAQSVSPTGTKGSNLGNLQARGDQYITQRLTSLNTLVTKINGLKNLKPEDKSQFLTNINADISGLTALKAKIDADTDVATARADVLSIFTTYRVYVVFDPQTQLLAASDTMTVLADELDMLANKLETRINEAGSGVNTTTLRNLLNDMRSKIADARTQYTNVENTVSPLTPASYNSNPSGTKATMQTARADITTGRTDLTGAWADAKQIRAGLHTGSTSGTPSPTPTPTP